MRKRSILIGAVSLAALGATHWTAYNRGAQSILDDDAPRRERVRATTPMTDLHGQIDVLRIAVKLPDDFSTEDIRKWRQETEATLSVVETRTLDFYKKKGDEGKEKLVRETIQEARDLLSKLAK